MTSTGRVLVFGGGSPVTVGTVQAFPGAGAARVTGSLPAPRSDAAAVTIGGTAYLVGGYDGSRPDASVLATTDGRTFTTVAALPVPVRYPAVAALDGQIYVFGGQAITRSRAGAPVNVIQGIDPARHTAAVIGTLPEPLAGAAAVTVDGELFVAGGDSPAASRLAPGLGTTQRPGQPRGGSSVSTIWAFDPSSRRLLAAGRLQVPLSHAAAAVAGSTAWIVGGESGGTAVSAVQMLRPDRAFGTAGAPGAGSPYFGGRLLIADRGNDRLLLLDAAMRVVWRYPAPGLPTDPLRFYFPDDAFFTGHGTAIISNQEQNETIIKLAHQHRRGRAAPAQPAHQVQAGQPGHAPVEDRDLVGAEPQVRGRGLAVGHQIHDVALLPKPAGQDRPQTFVILRAQRAGSWRTSLPADAGNCQASVSTRQRRPTMTEAYDGRQVAGWVCTCGSGP